MRYRSRQRGYLLITTIVALFVIAAIAMLLAQDSALSANTSNRELESARAEFLTQGALEHAKWQVANNACVGDLDIPSTALGDDSYEAKIIGASTGTRVVLAADRDAWIRNDDPTRNNGSVVSNHVRFEAGNIEQVLTRFDVSSIDSSAQVYSAIAWFHLGVGKTHPEGLISVHKVLADWDETSVTWDSFNGAYDAAGFTAIPAQDAGDTWVAINVTGLVQSWVNGQPNYGILFNSLAEGLHTEYTAREDGTNPPRLEVVTGSGPPSEVRIKAKGTLANGLGRNLKDRFTTTWQPPSQTMLQPDATRGVDAWITSGQTTWNNGAHATLRVQPGNQRTFLRMNLEGQIPVGARVTKATLQLWVTQVGTADSIAVHRVRRPWEEGSCFGVCAADDGITWETYDGANPWATAGGDIDALASSSATPVSTDAWLSWDVTELAATWAMDPSLNYGVLLKGNPGGAVFSSSDDTNPNLHPRLTVEYACECGSTCTAPSGNGNILMVVAEKTWLTDNEAILKSRFEAWGYAVTLISDHDNQNTFDGGFSTNDVVFVSESTEISKIGTKLNAAPIGIVNTHGSLNDDLGLESADSTNWPVGSAINITDTSHFITAPFAAGDLDIYDVAMGGLAIGTTKSPDLQSLAEWQNDSGLAALEAGAQTASGGTAPGRRVMLPLGRQTQLNPLYINSNGWLLIQRSISWAIGNGKSSAGNILLVVANAASPSTSDLDRQALIESWGYTVTLISDDAPQADFDAALLDVDAVYICGSGSSAELGTKLTNATVGVLSEDIGLVDEFGFAEPAFLKRSSQAINVLDNAHYITSGFGLGTLQLYTYLPQIWTVTGALAPGLEVLGETQDGGGSYPTGLAILESGAGLWGGGSAAGRRVQVAWSEGSFDINGLNADGQTIMKRAIEWATMPAAACTPSLTVGFVVGNATTLTSDEAARRSLLESWCYTVSLIDDGASQAEYDAAAGGSDAIYVSSEASATQVGNKLNTQTIGIVSEDPDLHNDLGFSSVRYRAATNAPLTTVSTHYITSPFSGSNITLYTSDQQSGAAVGTLPAGLVSIGDWSSGDLAPLGGLLTLETGATISGGGTAAGRRVQLPWDGNEGAAVADIGALTADGLTILQRSFEWAAGLDATPPLAHWKLDETSGTTAVDSEGGHDGTLVMAESWVPGRVDGGLDFDGVDDEVSVGAPATLDNIFSGGGTVTAWIYPRSYGAAGNRIVDKWRTDGSGVRYGWLFTLYTTENTLLVGRAFSGQFGYWHAPTNAIQLDTWQHVAVVYDDGSDANDPVLYIDGVPQTLTEWYAPSGTPMSDTGGVLTIGDRSDTGTTRTFDGVLDDVRIYDRMLTASEMAALASAGGSGGGGGPGPVFESYADAAASSGVTSLSIPRPGGTAEGDLLIAALATDGDSGTSFNPPAGWTPVSVGTSANNRVSFGVWWKIATGSEPSQYTFTWSGSEEAYGWVSRFTGHDPASPIIYENGTLTNDNTSTPICQRLITTEDNVMILRLGGFDDDDITIGDSGLAGHTTINMGKSGGGAGTTSGGSGYFIQSTAGDSDLARFQLTNNEEMRTVTLGIRPAP